MPFTFGQAASLSSSDLHRFRTHNTAIARAMAGRLSLFIRAEFSMELEEVSTMTFQKYTDNAPTPCHLVLFKVEPLQGIGVLDFAPSLGLVLTDRMLGGIGAMVDPDRPLREFEHSLIDQAARILLQEWVENWKTRERLIPRLLGFENNPKFLTICDPDEEVKVLKYTATMGDVFDRLQLVLPVKMSEPLIQQLTADTDVKKKDAASKESRRPKWNTAYDGGKLRVSAVWDDVEMLSKDLLDFKVGDLLRTDIERPGAMTCFDLERMVLVVSLETPWNTDQSGYVVGLDSGVRTEISCVWLWPGDVPRDLYYR